MHNQVAGVVGLLMEFHLAFFLAPYMWTVHSFFQLMHITDDHAANNDQIEATNGGQKGRQKIITMLTTLPTRCFS